MKTSPFTASLGIWKLQETSTLCVNLLTGRNAQKRPCSGVIFRALLLRDCRDALGLRQVLLLLWVTGLETESAEICYWETNIEEAQWETLASWTQHSICFYFCNDASRNIWGIPYLGWRGCVINRQAVRVYCDPLVRLNIKTFTVFRQEFCALQALSVILGFHFTAESDSDKAFLCPSPPSIPMVCLQLSVTFLTHVFRFSECYSWSTEFERIQYFYCVIKENIIFIGFIY